MINVKQAAQPDELRGKCLARPRGPQIQGNVLFVIVPIPDPKRLGLKAEGTESEIIVQFASREVLDHHRGLDDLNVLCCMPKHFLDELPRMVECALCPNELR
jgi:hypothetical protein